MKVIPAGHMFLRRLLDLAHSVPHLEYPLQLSLDSALDINWCMVDVCVLLERSSILSPTGVVSLTKHVFIHGCFLRTCI